MYVGFFHQCGIVTDEAEVTSLSNKAVPVMARSAGAFSMRDMCAALRQFDLCDRRGIRPWKSRISGLLCIISRLLKRRDAIEEEREDLVAGCRRARDGQCRQQRDSPEQIPAPLIHRGGGSSP